MKKYFSLFLIAALVLFAVPAFASVQMYEDGNEEGHASQINLSTGLDGSFSGGKYTVVVNLPAASVAYNDELPAFVVAAGANTACTTTCGIATAIVGLDAGTHALVATNSALADTCLCNGATS